VEKQLNQPKVYNVFTFCVSAFPNADLSIVLWCHCYVTPGAHLADFNLGDSCVTLCLVLVRTVHKMNTA